MINTLLVILLVIFVCMLAAWCSRSVMDAQLRSRGRARALGEERFEADSAVDAGTLDGRRRLPRPLRRRTPPADPAYGSMATRPAPAVSSEQRRAVRRAERLARDQYLDRATLGITVYIVVFIVASMLGLFAEEVWMWHSQGRMENRAGVVWGPFSPLYGFGGLLFTVVLWNFRKASLAEVFLVSMGVGAAIEQSTGMAMEYFWHAQSWTYLGLPDAITQWICWSSILVWGVLGVVYARLVLPEIVWVVGEPSHRLQGAVVAVLVVAISVDLLATAYCFYRMGQRSLGIPPQNAVDVYVDGHFNDEFIEGRFQNLVVGKQLAPNG